MSEKEYASKGEVTYLALFLFVVIVMVCLINAKLHDQVIALEQRIEAVEKRK